MIKKAHDAYNNKDFESAFKLYTQLSDEGNADAMASLGYMYQNAQEGAVWVVFMRRPRRGRVHYHRREDPPVLRLRAP